ncbi:MAG TPA: DUF3301 domain-containing protein [Steroidobacteraceae bacterium]|nr:DUF3301 domain-containing protein [Steroidobacteraceae bacterium]
MYLSFGTLGFLCVAALLIWFWQDGLRARDIANAAAMAACERISLQFLDGTAAFSRLRLVRDVGRLRLRRTYVFDYTAQSIERRQGFVILLGLDVEYVGFASEQSAQPPVVEMPENPASRPNPSAPSTPESNGKILDLNEHRARSLRNRRHH